MRKNEKEKNLRFFLIKLYVKFDVHDRRATLVDTKGYEGVTPVNP
jgi:hypothetical protein